LNRLHNKIITITGAANGIGLASARLFVEQGAHVVLVDLSEQALIDAVAALPEGRASYVVADVRDEQQIKHYIDTTVARHGRIDGLFSNAGIAGKIAPIFDYPTEAFDDVIATNVRGVWLSLKHVLPIMLNQGSGSVVLSSSIVGLMGFPGASGYVTSKHAVIGMMRSTALEVAKSGVRINTLNPGPIETQMMRHIEEGAAPGAGSAAKPSFEAIIPAGHYGEPEDVARLALFLMSDESRFCTGGVYSVDGGMSAA
jgi:NAD(P)-dependent dehydrogenase (short-subunit alcohol dehydrogenase family)